MPLPGDIIVKLIDNAVSALLKYRNEAAGHAFAVTGGGRGMGAIAAHLRYIATAVRLSIEDDCGAVRKGKEALRAIADQSNGHLFLRD